MNKEEVFRKPALGPRPGGRENYVVLSASLPRDRGHFDFAKLNYDLDIGKSCRSEPLSDCVIAELPTPELQSPRPLHRSPEDRPLGLAVAAQ